MTPEPGWWKRVHRCEPQPDWADVFQVTEATSAAAGLRPGWWAGDTRTYTAQAVTACPWCGEEPA